MLVFTNRVVDASANDESAFSARFAPGSDVLGMATVTRRRAKRGADWTLTDVRSAVSDADALTALAAVFAGAQPVLVHLHGNSMPPPACFERCARFEELFGVAVVAFSWPSEGLKPTGKRAAVRAGKPPAERVDVQSLADITFGNRDQSAARGVISRYRQSLRNGADSAQALARFLALVGKASRRARAVQPFSIAAHSLGAFCLEALFDRKLEAAIPKARNVALLAACVRKQGHDDWVARLPRSGQLVITTNVSDWVLLGAMLSEFPPEEKLGGAYPVGTLVGSARYVDFARRRPGAHEYFIVERGEKMDKDLREVFGRVFASGDDIPKGSDPCDAYRGCCDAALHVCDVG